MGTKNAEVSPFALYTGGGRQESVILAAIHRSPPDYSLLVLTNARWYDPVSAHWSNDWRAYDMARKPQPAAATTRTITASEQRVLKMKKQKGDPVKDDVYPAPKGKKDKAPPKPPPQPPVALDDVPDIADALPDLVTEYQDLLQQEAIIEVRKKELSSDITALLEAVGQRSVITETWQASRAKGCNVQISKTALLEEGVDLAIIEAATKRKDYTYVVVTDPRVPRTNKDKRGGEDGGDE